MHPVSISFQPFTATPANKLIPRGSNVKNSLDYVKLPIIGRNSGKLAMISRPNYALGSETSGEDYTVGEKDGVIIVDHGSRRQESNLMLNDFVAMFRTRTGYKIVEPAHMLAWTCYNFYQSTPTKLAGENYYFHAGKEMIVGASWNILRPETVKSLMYLWCLTGNKTYQDWSSEIFQAFEKNSCEHRYKRRHDAKLLPGRDAQVSLPIILPTTGNFLSFDEWVFNTEAHPLRIITRHDSEGGSCAAADGGLSDSRVAEGIGEASVKDGTVRYRGSYHRPVCYLLR